MRPYNRVLLVDDDPDEKDFFHDALERAGHSVDYAYVDNGEDALDMVKRGTAPDVIFLDLNMPRLDGREFLRRLASVKRLQTVPPVVVYSTSKNPKDHKDAMELGASGYIVKPNNLADLVHSLRGYLSA